MRILTLGGTGSVGQFVVREALQNGHDAVALVRNTKRAARTLPPETILVKGDVTTSAGLSEALDGVDAIIATLNGDPRRIDFEGMFNVLRALDGRRVHIVLMSVVGASNVGRLDVLDWKRRGERLVRASGNDFTIVRPAWFDMQTPEQQSLSFGQIDKIWDLSPAAGAIGRQQIARTLVAAAGNPNANGKTFDLLAENGPVPESLDVLFDALQPDSPDGLDAVYDPDNMLLATESASVQQAIAAVTPQ